MGRCVGTTQPMDPEPGSVDVRVPVRLKLVKDSKSENLPNTPALRVHYPELDAKETNVKMQKMAVCVKPLHNQYNRGLWVSTKYNYMGF